MPKTARERSDIYDTQAFVRLNIDLRQALALSALVVGVHYAVTYVFGGSIALLLLAPTVYFATLICTDRVRLLPSFALLTTQLAQPELEILRLVIFASILSYVPRRRQTLNALYALVILWAVALTAYWKFGAEIAAPDLLFRVLLEIVSFLILYFLLWTGRFSTLFHRLPPLVHSGAVVAALSLLVSLASALLLFNAFLATAEMPLAELTARIGQRPLPWLIALGGFLATTLLTALSLNTLLGTLALKIRELAEGGRPTRVEGQHAPRIFELEEVLRGTRGAIEQLRSDYREAQLSLKDLQHVYEGQQREVRERETRAKNLETVMNTAPLGCLAITAAGGVLSVNDRFFEATRLSKTDLVGQHFSLLEGEHPWRSEIATILTWAAGEYRKLLGKPPFACFTSSVNGEYLELSLEAKSVSEVELDDVRVDPHLPVSDGVIILAVRRITDLRDFQLRLLNPSLREVLGTQAVEICRDLSLKFSTFREHLGTISSAIRRSRAAAEAQLLLTELERFLEDASAPLMDLEGKAKASAKRYIEIDFGRLLQASFDYLYDLLAADEHIRIHAGQKPLSEQPDFQVALTADPSDLTQFIAYLLSFVQSILPRAPHLSVNLEYEEIGSSTASLVPGSRPGQYVRLLLSHPGQSITANMVPMSIRHLGPMSDEIGVTEVAIALLTHQTQQLGGFVSLQSSAQKGTFITIYVPEDPRRISRPPRHWKRQQALDLLAPRVLVLWSSAPRAEAIEKRLKANRYEVISRSWDELMLEQDSPLEFGGVGFGDSRGQQAETQLVLPDQAIGELGKYSAVLIMPDVPAEALAVLHNAASKVVPIVCIGTPRVGGLAVHEGASEEDLAKMIAALQKSRHVPAEA